MEEKQIDNGFVSIEDIQGLKYIIQRSFAGAIHFKALIMKKASVVKDSSSKENDNHSAKIKVFVMSSDLKKYQAEYVEIKFVEEQDQKSFIKVA